MQECKLHHRHDRIEVDTILGKMTVFDERKYKDDHGQNCAGQDIVSYVLTEEDCWERRLYDSPVSEILKNGNRDNLVLDVGAHIGWYTRMAIKAGYTTCAFEALPEHIELLRLNAPQAIIEPIWFDENTTGHFETDRNIEFLKIDIEGAEQYAIKYFEKVLHKINHILLEVSPTFNDSYPALLDKLKDKFEIMEHTGDPFNFDFNFTQKDLWLRKK